MNIFSAIDADVREKSNKVFRRVCKEANVFPSSLYKSIMKYMEANDTYVFYGRCDMSFTSLGRHTEAKFYKLQLDLAKELIEKNLLTRKDYNVLLNDTIRRYSLKFSHSWTNVYRHVCEVSNKKEFAKYLIRQYEKNIEKIPETTKERIYSELPT